MAQLAFNMNKLIYTPIDIDLTGFTFEPDADADVAPDFKVWWTSSRISKESIIKNNLQHIFDQLPFTKITRLVFKIQTVPAGPHYDVFKELPFDSRLEEGEYDHIFNNEPCGYRIVLNGGIDRLSIFVGKKWVTPLQCSAPCVYLINSTSALHQVADDPGRRTIYVRGFIDPEKNKILIERSLEKFKYLAIYSQ